MKKILCLLCLLPLLWAPAWALELEDIRQQLSEEVQQVTQGEGDGLVEQAALGLGQRFLTLFREHLRDSCKASLMILAVCALLGVGAGFAQSAGIQLPGNVLQIAGICAVTAIALTGTSSLLTACAQALEEMNATLKSLMPSFVAAMAASGNPVSSVATSTATLFFASLLVGLGQKVVFPVVSLYILVSAAGLIAQNPLPQKIAALGRWLCLAGFKGLLTVFTFYLTMSGILSAGADAATTKAAKVTISGVVPVLGSILSDASDALLTGARVLKNGIGILGMVAAIAICLAPFVRCLCFLLVYKVTAALGGTFVDGAVGKMLDVVGDAYTVLLGLLGSACILVFLSMVICTTVVSGP